MTEHRPTPPIQSDPSDHPGGDTQPEGDPHHVPMHEDTEDDADLDKFMPDDK